MMVWFSGSQKVKLVDGTALPTSCILLSGGLQPFDVMRIGWDTSATNIAVVIIGVDQDWVLHGTLSDSFQRCFVENFDTFQFT